MTADRVLGVLWLHARRLIDSALEASAFAIATGASVAVLRAKGVKIPLDGDALDPARFFAAPATFLTARLIVAEAQRFGLRHPPRVALAALAGAVLPLFCLAAVRGSEMVSAYIPVPFDVFDAAFWGAWMLIPIVAAAGIVLFERKP
jgi:hypothetical protein